LILTAVVIGGLTQAEPARDPVMREA